ncbi:MAG: hypothetical protein GY797_21275, partial [Deltaproteobacteria bacterium]|nr:hypothetical protein [Deltaproteobacteria bacterium]
MGNSPNPLYPLTSPQREIWFDQIIHEGIPLYNICAHVKIPGILDPVLFEQAVNLLVKKHDTLRTILTTVLDEDGIPMQTYVEKCENSLTVQDFSASSHPRKEAIAWMEQRFLEPFELTGRPLFRYDLVKISNDCYYWLAQYHHIIADGQAFTLISRSLAKIYSELVKGKIPNQDGLSYVNFIDHDRKFAGSKIFGEHRQYWLEKYSSPPGPLLNPRYRSQYKDTVIGSGLETFSMSREFYNRLHDFGKKHNTTFFRVMLGALYVYFTRTTRQDDFTVGFPTLNRVTNEFQQTAGLFVLASPSSFKFGNILNFSELLKKIDQTLKQDLSRQPFPLSEINRGASRGQGSHRTILYDISVSYARFDLTTHFNGIASQTTWLLNPWEQTPLTINVEDFHPQSDVKFNFAFNRAYFDTNDIQLLQARLKTIFKAVLENSSSPIRTLPIVTDEENQQLQSWNETGRDYSKARTQENPTLADLFEQQVQKTPDNIALVFEGRQLSY